MSIVSKISSKQLEGQTVKLAYQSRYMDKETLKNIFKFDVKAKGPLSYWLMREYTDFHEDEYNKAYFQHIMEFQVGDCFELNIPISSDKGILCLEHFKWKSLRTEPVSTKGSVLEFSNTRLHDREVIDFDLSRYCEIEILKNMWGNLSVIDSDENILKSIKSLFEPFFIVTRIFYDDIGYYLFKVMLLASQPGDLPSSKEIGIEIAIRESHQAVLNEVKKNCLLYDMRNRVEYRVGDIVVFYITKNKH